MARQILQCGVVLRQSLEVRRFQECRQIPAQKDDAVDAADHCDLRLARSLKRLPGFAQLRQQHPPLAHVF
jgi:hypothetical protein